MKINFEVNGNLVTVDRPPMTRLLDVLRADVRLTGTKEGCGEGECGACSVILNGKLVNSCLVPAAQIDNSKILTIEGVAEAAKLHRIQTGFWEGGGAQCGICTPGMILAALALLEKNSTPSQDEIAVGLSGNLCRCTGYTKIFESIVRVLQDGPI